MSNDRSDDTVPSASASTADQEPPATGDATVAALARLSGIDWVSKASEYALRELRATKASPRSGSEVFVKVKDLGVDIPVSESTFSQYMSSVAKLIESPVTSTGRGRGGGYYLSEQSKSLATEATAKDEQREAKEWAKEKWLYPSLVSWMVGEGYQAQDTSTIRSLGKWGNPDVTGLAVHEYLSRMEVEVMTVEAKLGFDAWEVDFFQAVSQRRFANRAYFAFALPEDAADKMPADLRYYSERFGVGVLVIDLANDVYERLTSGTLQTNDKTMLETNDGSFVREVLSAPWHPVPLAYHRRVCEALNINSIADLNRWGWNPS